MASGEVWFKSRHAFNALKYLSFLPPTLCAFLVLSRGVEGIQNIWLTSAFLSFIYSVFWDIFMDWGFFWESLKGGHPKNTAASMIRSQLLFTKVSLYWTAILVNLALRGLTLARITAFALDTSYPTSSWMAVLREIPDSHYVLLEIMRRLLWTIFRIEYQQTLSGKLPLVLNSFV